MIPEENVPDSAPAANPGDEQSNLNAFEGQAVNGESIEGGGFEVFDQVFSQVSHALEEAINRVTHQIPKDPYSGLPNSGSS